MFFEMNVKLTFSLFDVLFGSHYSIHVLKYINIVFSLVLCNMINGIEFEQAIERYLLYWLRQLNKYTVLRKYYLNDDQT